MYYSNIDRFDKRRAQINYKTMGNKPPEDRRLEDRRLKKNAEGYNDPTAYKAIKRADEDFERYQKLIGCLLRVCELSDFKIEGRITLVDKRTGKVWE